MRQRIVLNYHWHCVSLRIMMTMMMAGVLSSYLSVRNSVLITYFDYRLFFNHFVFHLFFSLGMILSVISIIATLFVYGCISKLRNLNGRCLMRYLIVLAIGFALIAWVQINDWGVKHPLLCRCIGYTAYFSFISAFSWLSVINFDMWLNSKLIVSRTGQNDQSQPNSLSLWFVD